jgi:hypothetical protein
MSRPDKADSGVQVLASILNEIGASHYFEVFIDEGVDDESLRTHGKFKPQRISRSYGLACLWIKQPHSPTGVALPARVLYDRDPQLYWHRTVDHHVPMTICCPTR